MTVDAMSRADMIVVEANHNIDMLKRGPYPAHLKRRVLSPVGHLSNDECGRLTETVRERSGKNPSDLSGAPFGDKQLAGSGSRRCVASFGGWLSEGLTPLPRGSCARSCSQGCRRRGDRRSKCSSNSFQLTILGEPGI